MQAPDTGVGRSTGSALPAFRSWGAPLEKARACILLVHGRGARAEDMLPLAQAIAPPGDHDLAILAPQAPGGTWYPYRFLAPLEQNEPHLSRSLEAIGLIVDLITRAGVPRERLLLGGFSQGACLALEWIARSAGETAARHPARYGGVAGLSGGLIGPPGMPHAYSGSLAGTPIFLGCSDVDAHIPKERVLETEQVLRGMGAQVTVRLYPGMGHMVNEDEVDFVSGMVAQVLE